jgi:hypothetical protein
MERTKKAAKGEEETQPIIAGCIEKKNGDSSALLMSKAADGVIQTIFQASLQKWDRRTVAPPRPQTVIASSSLTLRYHPKLQRRPPLPPSKEREGTAEQKYERERER